jgi:hypothetical protein
MENKQKPQRKAGKSSVSELFAAPIFAIVLIGAVEIASCQQVQAGTNYLASDTNSRYDVRTTTRSGAKPSPQSLAIFVPKICLINTQQVTTGTDKKVTSSNRYIYGAGHRAVRYDGLSEPNTIPFLGNKFRRLNAIVNDPFHPFFMLDLTHNQRSGGYHA